MISALFDDRRRGEIRDAIRTGRPIEFRRRMPDADALETNETLNSRIAEVAMKFLDTDRHEFPPSLAAIHGPTIRRSIAGAQRPYQGYASEWDTSDRKETARNIEQSIETVNKESESSKNRK